ncbi:MAG: hypothetical protein AAF215_17975 [Cyanobacteria bacterium P01_A01_bin.123]
MVQTIAVTDAITNLNQVHERFGLQPNPTPDCFSHNLHQAVRILKRLTALD